MACAYVVQADVCDTDTVLLHSGPYVVYVSIHSTLNGPWTLLLNDLRRLPCLARRTSQSPDGDCTLIASLSAGTAISIVILGP